MKTMREIVMMAVWAVMSIAAKGAETWWGYWTPRQGMEIKGAFERGTNDVAIYVPKGQAVLAGSTVKAVRFYISDKTAVIRLRVWMATAEFSWAWDQPNLALKDVSLADVVDVEHDGQMMTVEWDEPVSIPASGAYIGYTVTMGQGFDSHPCGLFCSTDNSGAQYGCYYQWSEMNKFVGNTVLQALVSSENLSEHAASPTSLGTQVMSRGTDRLLSVTLTQTGTEPIRSIGYVLSLDGTALPERTYTFPAGSEETAFLEPETVTLPIDLNETAAQYNATLTVTQVNGQPNGNVAATASVQGQIVLLDQLGVRRSVMEEFTGTWCTWCPRGVVGMRLLEQEFGDRFIGIAVHSDDPMQLSAYNSTSVRRMVSGLPNCVIDRTTVCDPYMGSSGEKHFLVNKDLERALTVPCVADIKVAAEWDRDEQDVVAVDVQTTFRYNDEDSAPYSIALILIENGMKGEGNDWRQVNRYAQPNSGFDDADMAEFRDAPHYITDMVYDHVAVDGAGLNNGISGSISLPLVSGKGQQFSYLWNLSQNTLIQDKEQLSVVALLLNTQKGSIENAAKVRVKSGGTTDILSVQTDKGTKVYYSIDGRRLSHPQRGMNVVRQTDGTVRKVIVK